MKRLFTLLFYLLAFVFFTHAQNYVWTSYYSPPQTFVDGGNSLWMCSGNTLIQFDKASGYYSRVNVPDSVHIFNDHQSFLGSNPVLHIGNGYPFVDTVSFDGQNWCTQSYLSIYYPVNASFFYYRWMKNNGVYYLFTDSGMQTYNGSGFEVYDSINQILANLGLSGYQLNSEPMGFDTAGNLWIGEPGIGMIKFDGQHYTLLDSSAIHFSATNTYLFNPIGIFTDPYTSIIYAVNHNNSDSSASYNAFDGQVWYRDSLPRSLCASGIQAMFFGSGKIFFCTDRGIISYDGLGYSFVSLPFQFVPPTNYFYYTVSADYGGYYWVMVNGILFLFDGVSFSAFPDSLATLYDNYVLNQIYDKSGNHILGYSSGLGDITSSGFQSFQTLGGNLGSMALDTSGRIWHSSNSLAYYFDTVDHLVGDSSAAYGFNSFAVDKSGQVWAATNNGIQLFSGLAFNSFVLTGLDINYSTFTCVSVDTANNKWVGVIGPIAGSCSSCPGGVIKVNGATWTMYDASNSPIPDSIQTINVDPQNRVWVGTSNSGLMVYFDTSWVVYNSSNSGLPGNRIEDIWFKNGNTYVSTQDNGIAIFDGTNWQSFTHRNSPLDNDCESIFMDENCNLWIGQECGLAKLSGICGLDTNKRVLHGHVYKANGSPSLHELVLLLKYDSLSNTLKQIDNTYTDGSGAYNFATDLSQVYVHALPYNNAMTGGIMPVYQDSALVQQNAQPILMNSPTVVQDLWSIEAQSLSGTGKMEGVVNDLPGNTVKGVRLFLMRSGAPVATAVTGMDGRFVFASLNLGSYKIWVDKMGIDNSLAPTVNFSVENTVSVSCQLTSTQLKIISVGLNETRESNSVKVYPNPSKGIFEISLGSTEPTSISIYDIMGNEVMQINMVTETQKVDLSIFDKGVYILKAQSNGQVFTRRIILNK